MNRTEFLAKLDSIIEDRRLLNHPFYQLWNQGGLSEHALAEYAGEYYHLVHRFPTFVSATHSVCQDLQLRQTLLENLIEEEQGPEHHPELWLRFADALGLDREAVQSRQVLPQTRQAVEQLWLLARNESPAAGLAALYAYESQVPEISTTKIAGLRQFYNINSGHALSFFQVHQSADAIHSGVTRAALGEICQDDETQELALSSAQAAADALNLLLDGVYHSYCSSEASAA